MMSASVSKLSFPKWTLRTLPVPALAVGGGVIAIWIAVLALHAAWIHKGMDLGFGSAGALLLLGICCAQDIGKFTVPKQAYLIPAVVIAFCAVSLVLRQSPDYLLTLLILLSGVHGASVNPALPNRLRRWRWVIPPLAFGAALSQLPGFLVPGGLSNAHPAASQMVSYSFLAVALISLKNWIRDEMAAVGKDAEIVGLFVPFLVAGWAFFMGMSGIAMLTGSSGNAFSGDFERPMAMAGTVLVLLLFSALALKMALLADRRSRTLREYEAQLVLLRAEVESVRVEADNYIQAAAHDMQAPLRHVSGFVQLLVGGERFRGDADLEKYSTYILDGTRRMTDMVSGLVDWGRIAKTQINRSIVDLAKVFRNAIASLNSEVANADGSIEIPDALPFVSGSGPMLEKAAILLLGNCIAYRSTGTPLRIKVEEFRSAAGIGFRVEDNGIGVKPEHRETVFAPFKRLHSYDRIKGVGLGLTLARRIVEKHGGMLYLEDAALGGVAAVAVFPN